MLGNPFGNQMGGMGGYGNINVGMGNSPLSFMGKNKNPGLGNDGTINSLGSPGVSMFPGNTPQRFNPQMNQPLGIPNGSAISRLGSMPVQPDIQGLPNMHTPPVPIQRNAPQGFPILGSMLPANQQMLPQNNGMVNKLRGLMPQNFNQNPGLGGLLQNPNTLAQLMRSRY